jgi:hypothetical protein
MQYVHISVSKTWMVYTKCMKLPRNLHNNNLKVTWQRVHTHNLMRVRTTSALISLWELPTKCQTFVNFITNNTDELPWLPMTSSTPNGGCRYVMIHPTKWANHNQKILHHEFPSEIHFYRSSPSQGKTQSWHWLGTQHCRNHTFNFSAGFICNPQFQWVSITLGGRLC